MSTNARRPRAAGTSATSRRPRRRALSLSNGHADASSFTTTDSPRAAELRTTQFHRPRHQDPRREHLPLPLRATRPAAGRSVSGPVMGQACRRIRKYDVRNLAFVAIVIALAARR